MANFNRVVTDPQVCQSKVENFLAHPENLGRWFLGRYAVSHTSGSQGQPMLIIQDRLSLSVFYALMCSRANPSGTPGVIEGIRRFWKPIKIAVVTMDRGFYPSGAATEFMPELVGRFVHVQRYSSMQKDLIDQLNRFQPNVLVSYASILETLALCGEGLSLPNLRQIANISEQLTARARARVEEAFGVPLPDHYAVGECLLLSNGCQRSDGAHINADWSILEVVDEEYRPVPPGTLGAKLLVTNLANRVQPFIRYEVPDRAAVSIDPCPCGSRLPRITQIEGRAAEIFWVDDGIRRQFLSGVLFHNAADSLGDVREWQAIQHERNRVEIRLELLPGSSRSSAMAEVILRKRLQDSGLPRAVAIDVKVVPSLAPDPKTGKFRRMLSTIGAPENIRG